MTASDVNDLRRTIRRAAGDEVALRHAFESAIDLHGRAEASRLWWAAFAAADASET